MSEARTDFLWIIEVAFSDPLYVTPQEAAAVTAAMEGGAVHVKVQRNVIAVNAIRRVWESDKLVPFEEEIKAITAGDGSLSKSEPLLDPITHAVRWKWQKKVVARKQWDSVLSKSHGYYKLEDAGTGGVWVGLRYMLETNQLVNPDLYDCTPSEVRYLDKVLGIAE